MSKNYTPKEKKILKVLRSVLTHATEPGYFNPEACGLAFIFIYNIKSLLWVITTGKAKSKAGISVGEYLIHTPAFDNTTFNSKLTAINLCTSIHAIAGLVQGYITKTGAGVPVGAILQSSTSAGLFCNVE